MSSESKPKIVVRHALFLEVDGRLSPCGARLHKGDAEHLFPRDCLAADGTIIFDFDDAAKAKAAAVALERYINANTGKKRIT